MNSGLFYIASGTVALVGAGVNSTRVVADSGAISDTSTITLGLVVVALLAVGKGAWKLRDYLAKNDSFNEKVLRRLRRVEKREDIIPPPEDKITIETEEADDE